MPGLPYMCLAEIGGVVRLLGLVIGEDSILFEGDVLGNEGRALSTLKVL
jgi:hypothetical protein